jgi:hypothetical protein
MSNVNIFLNKNHFRVLLTFLFVCTLAFSSHTAQALELAWAKRAGGTSFTDGIDIAVDSSGNTYVTGEFQFDTTFGVGEAGETTLFQDDDGDIFVAKYTVDGNLAWAKRAGGEETDSVRGIAVDDSGNVYITGFFSAPITFGPGEVGETTLTSVSLDFVPSTDIFIAKYTADGNLVWAKRAGGITDFDQGQGVAVDSSGNAYVTGAFGGAATFGLEEAGEVTLTSDDDGDIFVAKYATDGDLIWVKRAGGPDSEMGNGITVDGSGNTSIIGKIQGTAIFGPGETNEATLISNNNGDVFVAKYATDGDLIWAKLASTGSDVGHGIAVDGSGNTFVTGSFVDTTIFDSGQANETMLTSDGGNDIFVAKYAANGGLVWAKRAGGTSFDVGNGLAMDNAGNAYVTGSFAGTAIFGPGEVGEAILTSDGGFDIFVAKYTADGNLVEVKHAGGAGSIAGRGIAVDGTGNAHVTGSFTGTVILGLGEDGETTLTNDSTRFSDIFVARYSASTQVISTVVLEARVTAGSDDAEENTATGKMNRGSSDLELVEQGVKDQLMGIRFNGLTIPAGATITNAYIQFQVDETDSRTTNLMITGHATDNAPTFTTANANISSRNRTNAVVDWSLVPWTTVGEAGPDQQTPDITSLVQEIVERPGWSSGNSLAVIITGSGRRPAESYDGDVAGAPTLHVEYTQGTVTNQAPTVNGGSDQSVSLPAGGNVDAILNGTVSDDGLPIPVGVTTTWSQVSGPSTVIFGDANAEDTSANFDTAGSYVLRLTADDGDLSSFAEITVTVNAAGSATIVEVSVSASNDDAEEKTATGKMDRGSSDLELVDQGSNNQLVGMRFNNLSIPQSATITNAYLQFQVDETHSGSAALMIEGEATDDAQAFTTANGNISSRNLTGATVNWAPAPWTTVGDTGADQQTPDLTSVVQEIVDRSGWSSGNSLVIIISGNGLRTAESFNGDAAGAPRLHVEYQ